MVEKQRRQHYVWQHYLESWTKKGKIVCMKDDGKTFEAKPKNVAVGTDFYRQNELTSNEVTFLLNFFSDLPTPLRVLAYNWINIFNSVFELKKAIPGTNASNKIDELFDTLINNSGETIQTCFENIGYKYLHMLRDERTDFFEDEDHSLDFTIYLTMQYYRTKCLRDKILANKDIFEGVRPDEIWEVMGIVFATNTAYSISNGINDWELIPLKNNTTIPFITSDQPVINIYGNETEKLVFYYPIKPDFSILLKKKNENYRRVVNESDVLFYNDNMVHHSDMMIFGNSMEIEKFISKHYHNGT